MRTLEIKKKLSFADYLINRTYADTYPEGAIKHILDAANMIVVDITGLEESKIGPQVIHNRLNKINKKEAKEFSEFYIKLWKLSSSKTVSKDKTKESLNTVKNFLTWAQEELIKEEIGV